MTVTVKNKTPLIVPPSIRRRAGLKDGEELEFRASGGVITIMPKVESADDEYTPEQRKKIDARLAEAALSETIGPFDTAEEMIASIKEELKKRRATQRKQRRK
jgi:bifunctional DNA-binding transcriptional regulator/antitoxin component of YhaV-PrlF toxin-antitoxin module